MPIRNFNEIAQRLQDIMIDSLPKMVDDCIKKLLKTQVPLHVTQGLILERQQSQADVAKMIADAIQHEYENLHSEISSQINDAITNHIPSQVDSSVRNYVSDHILHLQQDDLPIWLALKYKFERLNVSSTLCRPSVIRTRDQEDPHNDAYLEGENMQRGNQEQLDDFDFWTDSYATNDDELPTKKVSQELMDEVSQTVDEAKLHKVVDEILRQQCTSGDEHQYHIDQICQRDPKALAMSLVNQENGNSFKPAAQTTINVDGTSTLLIPGPVTTKEKVQKKNDVKARSMLLMALPSEHLMTFNQHKDAKTLFAAIQTRFGGNKATKMTQKTLLKQMYENFKDLNLKFLRSLLFEWTTHIVVWRIKPDLDIISFDDLYNNFKIVEQEVNRTASSSSSSSSHNMAFVSSPSSTNEVNTAYGVSTVNTQISPTSTHVSTASTQVSTTNLSDATVYAFLAIQPNMSQLVYEDLEQIHEDDLEEMDLKWQLALLSMRTRRFFQKTGKKITINGSNTAGYDKSKVVGILDLMRQNE
ncbi:hypothetical protein Tco_1408726 [Tanacetum coccineum]